MHCLIFHLFTEAIKKTDRKKVVLRCPIYRQEKKTTGTTGDNPKDCRLYRSFSSTTFSTCCVCGNISTGCTFSTRYFGSSRVRSRACVAGLQLT